MNSDPHKVKNLATRFRDALEAEITECQNQGIHGVIDEFPRGACGEASQLLATYLREHGCVDFVIIGVCGTTSPTHGWNVTD